MNCDSRLYRIWNRVRQKCNSPKDSNFDNYGGKGIIIVEEWDDFETFKKWSLANGYDKNKNLKRKDPNGDYEPDNCEWIIKEPTKINFKGHNYTFRELSEKVNIRTYTLRDRYRNGLRDDALVQKTKYTSKGAPVSGNS